MQAGPVDVASLASRRQVTSGLTIGEHEDVHADMARSGFVTNAADVPRRVVCT